MAPLRSSGPLCHWDESRLSEHKTRTGCFFWKAQVKSVACLFFFQKYFYGFYGTRTGFMEASCSVWEVAKLRTLKQKKTIWFFFYKRQKKPGEDQHGGQRFEDNRQRNEIEWKKRKEKKGRHRYFLRNKEQGLASVKKKNHPATITIDATVSLASPHSDPV